MNTRICLMKDMTIMNDSIEAINQTENVRQEGLEIRYIGASIINDE